MARHFGKMLCTLWDDPDFLALSSDAKVLFSAFFSQPDITPAGILPWTERRWRRWLNGDAERVSVAFDELTAGRYVIADEDTSEVLVRSFIKTDGRLTNGKLAASVAFAVTQIRSDTIAACVQVEHPGKFPRGRAKQVPSGSHRDSGEGRNAESGRDPYSTQRNREEETSNREAPSDGLDPVDDETKRSSEDGGARIDRDRRLELLVSNGARLGLCERPSTLTAEPA